MGHFKGDGQYRCPQVGCDGWCDADDKDCGCVAAERKVRRRIRDAVRAERAEIADLADAMGAAFTLPFTTVGGVPSSVHLMALPFAAEVRKRRGHPCRCPRSSARRR